MWYYQGMKHKHQNHHFSDVGAVSMITVIFVTIILMVIVIGFIRIMISEQRQATDDDLTTRAFYAAESGVEDAKDGLSQFMLTHTGPITNQDLEDYFGTGPDECDTFGDEYLIEEGSALETRITCQIINTEPDDVVIDNMRPWHSVSFPLMTQEGNDIASFSLEWHMPVNDGLEYALKTNDSLEQTSDWRAGGVSYPAGMKVTLMKDTGNREDNIEATRIKHMLPGSGGSNTFAVNSANFGLGDDNPSLVTCDTGVEEDEYACSVSFAGLNNTDDYYVTLTPLYESTSVRLQLLDGNGDNVGVLGVQALVDVTAQAGDVFRRVESRVFLGDPATSLIPDLAVGANEICKDYALRDDPGEFEAVNPGVLPNYCMQ